MRGSMSVRISTAKLGLSDDRYCKVVPGAADVAGPPGVYANNKSRSLGQASKYVTDRGRGGVVDEDEVGADRHLAGAHFAKPEDHTGADGNSTGLHLVGQHLAAVELANKERMGSEPSIDTKLTGLTEYVTHIQKVPHRVEQQLVPSESSIRARSRLPGTN